MKVGQRYAISSPRSEDPLRATLVSLSVDPPRPGWVQVRLQEGITEGRVIAVYSRRVLAEWDKRNQPRPRRKSRPREVVDHSALRAGETVFWPEKSGELRWKLVAIDSEKGTAQLKGQVFGQAQSHRDVPMEALERPSTEDLGSWENDVEEPEDEPEGDDDETGDFDGLATEETGFDLPEDFLPRLMERATFGRGLLDRYRGRWARKNSRKSAADQLRQEILRRGKVFRRRRRGADEYVRIRVGRRYELIVPESPSAAEFIHLKRIVPVSRPKRAKPKRRKQAGKQRRRRAA
jgi:hypothetical protein